mgnify:CR=1 FL=1
MKEVIQSVFINYISCAIFGGFLQYLAPERMKKFLRACIVSVMLIVSLSPILKIDFNFENIGEGGQLELQTQYDTLMHTANLMEKEMYNHIKNILINLNVNEYEIYVTTSVDKENKTVYLKEVVIEVDKAFQNMLPEIIDDIPTEYKSIVRTGVKNE